MKNDNTGTLINVGRACMMLSVSRPTLRTMIRDGRIEAVKLGPKTTRVRLRSVRRLIRDGVSE